MSRPRRLRLGGAPLGGALHHLGGALQPSADERFLGHAHAHASRLSHCTRTRACAWACTWGECVQYSRYWPLLTLLFPRTYPCTGSHIAYEPYVQ